MACGRSNYLAYHCWVTFERIEKKKIVIERGEDVCLFDHKYANILSYLGVNPRQNIKPAPSLPLREVQGPGVEVCCPHSSL